MRCWSWISAIYVLSRNLWCTPSVVVLIGISLLQTGWVWGELSITETILIENLGLQLSHNCTDGQQHTQRVCNIDLCPIPRCSSQLGNNFIFQPHTRLGTVLLTSQAVQHTYNYRTSWPYWVMQTHRYSWRMSQGGWWDSVNNEHKQTVQTPAFSETRGPNTAQGPYCPYVP